MSEGMICPDCSGELAPSDGLRCRECCVRRYDERVVQQRSEYREYSSWAAEKRAREEERRAVRNLERRTSRAQKKIRRHWASLGIPDVCWLATAPGHECHGPIHADHVLPVRPRIGGNGVDDLDQLVPLCERANTAKSNQDPSQWLLSLPHALPGDRLASAVVLMAHGIAGSVSHGLGLADEGFRVPL